MSWLWMAAAVVCEVGATLGLRASDGLRRRWWLVPVASGYLAAFVFLALALAAGMPVSVAYGVWTAIGVALVAVLARVLWQDPLTPAMLAGLGLIIVGVLVIEGTSRT